MKSCTLCPRLCGVNRASGEVGFCGQSGDMRVARAALHLFEEPPISGTRGSGTVFFSGCSLRCAFCQNRKISRDAPIGQTVSPMELAQICLSLEAEGAHNINLVTPTHFTNEIRRALESVKHRLTIPVVWNTSGYERVETLRTLDGLVDVYMPDFKYLSPTLSQKYSAAPDYGEVVSLALPEMYRQVGKPILDSDGLLRRGMVVRHLVLPSHRKDSIAILEALAELLPPDGILLSLMSQYTPEFAMDAPYTELHRRITSFEYDSVVKRATELGFDGFIQQRTSATSVYTPDF